MKKESLTDVEYNYEDLKAYGILIITFVTGLIYGWVVWGLKNSALAVIFPALAIFSLLGYGMYIFIKNILRITK